MACATLKRSPDWEGVAQLPAKRRRCGPFGLQQHQLQQPQHQLQHQHQHQLQLQANQQQQQQQQQQQRQEAAVPSPFPEPTLKLTPERMAQEICDEIKRLQHRRQLRMSGPCGSRNDSDGSSSGSEGDSPRPPHTRVLFTFKQVRMICERMLREQEAALRAEYEAALCGKLAEQYESFVRFSQDQVQRRHLQPQDISYLS